MSCPSGSLLPLHLGFACLLFPNRRRRDQGGNANTIPSSRRKPRRKRTTTIPCRKPRRKSTIPSRRKPMRNSTTTILFRKPRRTGARASQPLAAKRRIKPLHTRLVQILFESCRTQKFGFAQLCTHHGSRRRKERAPTQR